MADDLFNSMLGDVAGGALSLDKPDAPDPIFSGLLDDAKKQEQSRNAIAAKQAMAATPDRYAEHLGIAQSLGVPVDFVGRNEKELKEFKGFTDIRRMMDNNPPLARWYAEGDNPAAIKVDELRHLSGLSWLSQAAGQSFKDAVAGVDFNDLQYRKMMGTATGDDLSRLGALEASQEPRTYGADTWLQKGFVGTAAQLPVLADMLMGSVRRGIEGAAYGGTIAAIAGQAGPQVALPEELITVPIGMATGYSVGSAAGAYERSAQQQAGAAFYEFSQMRDENGQPLDPTVAKVAAIVSGYSAGALDALSFGKMKSVIPGLDNVKSILGKDAIKHALMRPSVRMALTTFAKNIAETGATETATETVQEAMQIFAGEAAKEYSNQTNGGQFTMATGTEVRDRLADTFEQTLQVMTVLGPALSGSRLGTDLRKVRQAGQSMQVIEALNAHAKESELNARLPKKAEEAVRSLTENGPVQHVYIAPEAFSTYFQSAEEASRFAATMDLTDEYNESQRVGRDMEIPIEKYYVNMAGTDIGEALKGYVKFSPDAMSAVQADEFNQAWQEAQQRLSEDHAASMATDQAAMLGEERVFEDVKNKAMNAGIVPDQAAQYAKLYSQFFRTMAARSGQDAGELYATYGFDVKRALPTEQQLKAVDNLDLALAAIRAGRVDPLRKQVTKAAGPSLLEAIIARGGIVDQGGELAAMNAPKRLVRTEGAAKGQGDLVGGTDNQFGADDVARQMWEEGYFPDLTDRPTPDDLFNAIREEQAGNVRRSAHYDASADPRIQQADGLVKFADMLDQLGLDPATMTNDEIRAAVDEAVNRDPNAAALFQVPPDVAKQLTTPLNLPTDETFVQAVANTPGAEITPDGLLIDLTRWQPDEQSGSQAIRTGVFYLPSSSSNLKHYKGGKNNYGGDVKVQGETLIRNPLFVKGATGGKAPETAYDTIKGKGSHASMEKAVNSVVYSQHSAFKGNAGIFEEAVSNLLDGWGGNSNLAWTIIQNSKKGNQLRYALKEHIVAHAIREAGHDAMVGWSKGKAGPFISEVFDVREEMNPTPEGDFQVFDEYYQTAEGQESTAAKGGVPATETPEFRAWFGDSKVVDADGNPLVVYHGTAADFEAFDGKADAKHIALPGIFFTPDAGIAEWFAASASRKEFRDKDGYIAGYEGAAIVPAYLAVQNPATIALPDRETGEMSGTAEVRTALEAARAAGHDGAIITGWTDGSGDVQYVAFEPTQIKSVNNRGAFDAADPRILYQQEGKQEPAKAGSTNRGSIQLAPGRTIINMFDQADLSTFLHESGHFFLEVFRDLAVAQPKLAEGAQGPENQIVSDWNAIRDYLGITDDANIGTDAHEKWARSFEAYLFEGTAPSQDIATAFARFRSWLGFVYESIKQLKAPINDKIRNVMDRLIATDQEIEAAKRAPEFRPAFMDKAASGMTDKQWENYTAQAGRAVDRAKREMDARMMQEIARETTKEWRDAKRAIRTDVASNLEKLPVYRVMQYLRTGEGLPEGVERMYLDRDGIVSVMGEGALQRMPKGVPPLYRAKGGVHPDIMAELFGFKSGHEMLTLMMSVPSFNKAVADETALRMRQTYGDLMGDAVARARVAAEAIANDETGDLLNAEIEVLIRKGLATTAINKADARRLARGMVRGKTIREALRVKLYQNADAKAAWEAERAILKGDWATALGAKKRQLLNHYMAQEAAQSEKDVQKAVDYLNKFTGRKQPKGIRQDEITQIAKLLERFDLRKSVTLKDEDRRASFSAWLKEQEGAGEMPVASDILRPVDNTAREAAVADAFRKPYRQMTVDDLMAIRDTVKSIEHIGRRWQAVMGDIEARKFNAKRDEIATAVATSQPLKKEDRTRNPTRLGGVLNQAKSLEAAMLKMENVFDWMDSKDINGPLRRLVWQPIADAEAKENELRIKVVGEFQRIMGKLDHARLNERISILGVKRTFLRSEIMAVALNLGNEGNLDKMKRGETWDDATIDRIVSHLNADEWQAVQGIWDTINSLWPDIAALQRRLTGVEPPKVEARKVATPYGTLNGGYYPLIYDPRLSPDVADREAAAADKLFENTYLRPETRHGFTKERSKQHTRQFLFDINGAGRHLTAVVHDLTHREAILDAHKLLTNPVIRATIEGHYGRELYQQFVPWLQSIAHDAYKNDGLGAVENLFRSIRSRSTIMGMGFRITTIISQLAGYSSSLEMVPVKHMVGAMKDFTTSPRAMWNEVNAKSGEMRYRSANLDRDINEQLKRLTGKESLVDRATKFSLWGIGFMDRVVTVPTWTAAYRDHLSKMPTDDEGAIAHADKVVRMTQGAGAPKDLAAITRRNELTKLVTMFYSYFSAYYNRQRTWGRDVHRKITRGEGSFADLLARQVFMTVGPALLTELLVGRGPDKDQSWAEWAAKKIAFYPVAAVPIVRDALGVFDTGFGYNFTPSARVIDELLVQPFKMIAGELDDNPRNDPTARKAVKQTLETTGYALNLPLGQLSSTVDNVWKGIEEDDFQLRDIVLSRPKK